MIENWDFLLPRCSVDGELFCNKSASPGVISTVVFSETALLGLIVSVTAAALVLTGSLAITKQYSSPNEKKKASILPILD
jgi:hypothetical protein